MTGHKVLIKYFPLITIFVVVLILDLDLIKLMYLLFIYCHNKYTKFNTTNFEGQRKGI